MEPLLDCPCSMKRDEIEVGFRWTAPRFPGDSAGLQIYHPIPGNKECIGPEIRGPWATYAESFEACAKVSEAFTNRHALASSDPASD